MSLNLQELEKVSQGKKRSVWAEIRDFVMIFVLVFWFGWLFINAQLFIVLFDNIFHSSVSASDIVVAAPTQQITISQSIQQEKKETQGDDMEQLKKRLLENSTA